MLCTRAREMVRVSWTRKDEINAKLADTRNVLTQR